MLTWHKIVVGLVLIAILSITIIGYFYPNHIVSKLMVYYNSISSIILVGLTLAYVITTNMQLKSMKSQMKVMDKSINLQVQPLPVPTVKKTYLEKINAYVGPEDKFSSIQIIYRFHQDIKLANAGSGAALNTVVFTSLTSKKGKTFPAFFSRDQVHCLGTKVSDTANLSILALDNGFGILSALLEHELTLRMDIFYKNIFGAGFHEQADYFYHLDDKNKEEAERWLDFLKNGVSKYSTDMKRYSALHDKVPSDAKEIMSKIRKEIEPMFSTDINLDHFIAKESFEVKIIDYTSEVLAMEKKYKLSCDEYDKSKAGANIQTT
jgi:hypothetical protein